MRLITILLCVLFLPFYGKAQLYITTVAGNGTLGYSGDNGAATAAQLANPRDIAIDDSGNLYIIDEQNVVVRKVSADGIITTIAGIAGHVGFNGDSIMATDATLSDIWGIAVDKQYNIYVADGSANRIRKISSTGLITTVAGTGIAGYNGDGIAATAAQINYPTGICIDKCKNIYIAENNGYRIRKIDSTGIISTIAGMGISGYSGDDGPATTATLWAPDKICVDTAGNVYTSDCGGSRIRKVTVSGYISTIAGDGSYGNAGDGGPATAAQLNGSVGIKVDRYNNIYIADAGNNKIRMINAFGDIYTIAGQYSTTLVLDGAPATSGALAAPEGIEVDSNGTLYITEMVISKVRKTYLHTVNVSNTPIREFTIAPNPNNGNFNIELPSSLEKIQLTIFNALGQQVYSNEKKQVQHLLVQTELPNGVYYVKIITQDEISTQQITINN